MDKDLENITELTNGVFTVRTTQSFDDTLELYEFSVDFNSLASYPIPEAK